MTASPQQCRPKASACRTLVQPEPLLQVKVVGLFKSSSFQVSKTIAEELRGETWVYSSYVMCFVNDQLLGNAFDLKKWAQKVWDVVDVRPSALYEALTLDYATKFLKDTKASYIDF
ncbi:Peptidyl-prolyl cis-trans isomerase-like 6 [Cricetulus griseus]|uniref:Peptidyl-prolyl cis-trans isomerase-like 6 n=1 Tax=Cricetulus griseus TaxID=10029 RepID=G3GXL5_CRIGR|nr:Peptidyl-prolyl cis-trans isomerase-like 6 [Cricetulus griseus]